MSSILGLNRDERAAAPLTPEPVGPVSPLVLRRLHDELVRQKRRNFLIGLPLLIAAPFRIAIAATDPLRHMGMGFLSLTVIVAVGRLGYEWRTLRRADPVALYEAEQAQAEQSRRDLIVHTAKSEEVAPIISTALPATIVVVTIVQFLLTNPSEWLAAGALVKPRVAAGEWWRLLTASYLHGSVVHVSANAGALFSLGRLIEVYDRPLRAPLVYLVAALAGGVFSTVLSAAPSVGASGGALGLAGYLLAIGRRPGSPLPAWVRRETMTNMGLTAIIGLVLFFLIDNAGHAGGALAGFAAGLALPKALPSERRDPLDLLGAVAAVILAAGAFFTIARLLGLGIRE